MGGGHRDLTAADSPNWANSRPRVALRLRFGKATLMDGSAPPVPTQHAALTRAGRRRPVSVQCQNLEFSSFDPPPPPFPSEPLCLPGEALASHRCVAVVLRALLIPGAGQVWARAAVLLLLRLLR